MEKDYYHASPIANIEILEPRISNHNVPLVYFSAKRENVLVYLSNAVEKYCEETGFSYNGTGRNGVPMDLIKAGNTGLCCFKKACAGRSSGIHTKRI